MNEEEEIKCLKVKYPDLYFDKECLRSAFYLITLIQEGKVEEITPSLMENPICKKVAFSFGGILHVAANNPTIQDLAFLQKLVKIYGTQILFYDDKGNLPLHIAIAKQNFHFAKLLLKTADSSIIYLENNEGKTFLQLAMDQGEPVASVCRAMLRGCNSSRNTKSVSVIRRSLPGLPEAMALGNNFDEKPESIDYVITDIKAYRANSRKSKQARSISPSPSPKPNLLRKQSPCRNIPMLVVGNVINELGQNNETDEESDSEAPTPGTSPVVNKAENIVNSDASSAKMEKGLQNRPVKQKVVVNRNSDGLRRPSQHYQGARDLSFLMNNNDTPTIKAVRESRGDFDIRNTSDHEILNFLQTYQQNNLTTFKNPMEHMEQTAVLPKYKFDDRYIKSLSHKLLSSADCVEMPVEDIEKMLVILASPSYKLALREACARCLCHMAWPDENVPKLRKKLMSAQYFRFILELAVSGRLTLFRHIDIKKVVVGDLIARGGAGAVYSATYQGEQVVLKIMSPTYSLYFDPKEFYQEITIMTIFDHPSLIPCHGGGKWTDREGLFTIMPMFDCSLDFLIRSVEERQIPLISKIKIAAAIARGLAKLHSCGVIHRDVKPGNILLKQEKVEGEWFGASAEIRSDVVIADYGTCTSSLSHLLSKDIGTMRYTAPEIFQKDNGYGLPVDVYSFGMVLYELITGILPFEGFADVPVAIIAGERPAFPQWVPSCLKQLISACWDQNPLARPKMNSVHTSLNDLFEACLKWKLRQSAQNAKNVSSTAQPKLLNPKTEILKNFRSNSLIELWSKRLNTDEADKLAIPSTMRGTLRHLSFSDMKND